MTRINLGERNDMALAIQAEQYKESIAQEMERKMAEKSVTNPNDVAKREIATELMIQGFSEEAICRILNLKEENPICLKLDG